VANAVRLARAARLLDVPCWGTEQNPQGLGPIDPALRPLIDTVVAKMTFAAAEQLLPKLRPAARAPQGNARSLPKHLQKPAPAPQEERGSIVLAGCEAHVCLLQTALELLENEMEVWVVTDACSSRTERNRDAAFDRLAGAGCELVTTEMVIFEWLGSAEHPRFKEALALVK
jgi:nicotinamidase-related amidase